MSMVDLIKQMAFETSDAQTPVNIVIGTVVKVSPIEIEISQKLKLTKDFLIMTERVKKLEIDFTHNHGGTSALSKIVIREGLKVNDRVALFRVQGGQQYLVSDKVVD
ncbi:DUF2577 domain-containing protein [Sporosarcina sp. CAU 1771]